MMYLDNAATTIMAPEVVETIKDTSSIIGNPSSPHSLGMEARLVVDDSRSVIAKALGCSASELVFTSGGSESNGMVLRSLLKSQKKKLVVAATAHKSVLNQIPFLKKYGVSVSVIGVDSEGFVKMDALEKELEGAGLVSIVHANNEIGTIENVSIVASLCKKHNVLLHVDCVQSFGKVAFGVDDLGADFVSISAHKVHGPKGVGGLYVRNSARLFLDPLFPGSQENAMRAGTENVAGIAGFAKAVSLFSSSDVSYMSSLRDRLINKLGNQIPGLVVNGAREKRLCNNVNVYIPGVDAHALVLAMDDKGFCISTGAACTSSYHEPSHVIVALGGNRANSSIRITVSKYTKTSEIDDFVTALGTTLEELK